MSDAQTEGRRIAIEEDLAEFVLALTPGGGLGSSPFQTVADLFFELDIGLLVLWNRQLVKVGDGSLLLQSIGDFGIGGMVK